MTKKCIMKLKDWSMTLESINGFEVLSIDLFYPLKY